MATPKVNRPHLPHGRSPKQPPQDAARRIEALAADGFSYTGIARGLNVCAKVLRRWLDEVPALREALDAGRELERHALHNMLYRAATEKGNTTAAMFLLKARHGYREGDLNEQANRVQITFALPGAMTMQEFGALTNGADQDQRLPTARAALTRAG